MVVSSILMDCVGEVMFVLSAMVQILFVFSAGYASHSNHFCLNAHRLREFQSSRNFRVGLAHRHATGVVVSGITEKKKSKYMDYLIFVRDDLAIFFLYFYYAPHK